MIVGANIDPRNYDERVPMYPDSRMCRVFGYAKRGMPTWRPATGDDRVAHLHRLNPAIIPALVFQDWPDDQTARTRVTALLDEIDGPARLCWRHEADRKSEEPTTYRHRYFALAGWLADHPARQYVTLTPTSTYQWTMPKVDGKGHGDWSKYHVGVGHIGVDVYADSWRADYPDPDAFLGPLWRYRDLVDQPMEFPEFGAARVAGDEDGKRRADWLAKCAEIMAREGLVAVSYWDDLGSNLTDLRLSATTEDTPEVRVWRDVMRAQKKL